MADALAQADEAELAGYVDSGIWMLEEFLADLGGHSERELPTGVKNVSPAEEQKITVSRDALRADLAEMELRLLDKLVGRASFDALATSHRQLSSLVQEKIAWADGLMPLRDKLILEHMSLMTEHEHKISGEFTKAQNRTLDDKIEEAMVSDRNSLWVYRRNWIAVAALVVSVASVIVLAIGAIHGL